MLYCCRSINIEYKWLCFGICFYTGKVREGSVLHPNLLK